MLQSLLQLYYGFWHNFLRNYRHHGVKSQHFLDKRHDTSADRREDEGFVYHYWPISSVLRRMYRVLHCRFLERKGRGAKEKGIRHSKCKGGHRHILRPSAPTKSLSASLSVLRVIYQTLIK